MGTGQYGILRDALLGAGCPGWSLSSTTLLSSGRRERAHRDSRANVRTKARSPSGLDRCKAIKAALTTPPRDESVNMRHVARAGLVG